MGCSNPHPHGQIWASSSIPVELSKETEQQEKYFQNHHQTLLSAYLDIELQKQERIVLENEHFVALHLVPISSSVTLRARSHEPSASEL